MDVRVKLTRYNQTPRKTRLVADLIRGKKVDQALGQLSFVTKRASEVFKKLVNSGIANAKHNFSLNREELFVKEVRVDKGVVFKRGMPRAFGRSSPIRKRNSNITLVLSDGKTEKIAADQKVKTKAKK